MPAQFIPLVDVVRGSVLRAGIKLIKMLKRRENRLSCALQQVSPSIKKELKGEDMKTKIGQKIVYAFAGLFLFTFTAGVNAADVKPIKLRYSNGLATGDNISKDQKYWAEQVEKKTNGRVKVEVYQAGQLYKHTEVLDAVSTGAVDMGLCSVGENWPGRNPIFEGTQIWFMISSAEQMNNSMDPLRGLLFPMFEKYKVKPLHWWSFGEGGLLSRVPINKPADLKGLVVRAPTNSDWTSLKALGATPATISSPEEYDALSKKAIHATRTGIVAGSSRKLYEVTSYCTTPTGYSIWLTFINPDSWKKLTPDLQQIIMDVSKETELRNRSTGTAADIAAGKNLQTKLTYHLLTTAEVQKDWAPLMKPLIDDWLKRSEQAGTGPEAKKMYEILEKVRK
jgi:TRAP-type C4-dicarboxylate transport system substrate-binding protein